MARRTCLSAISVMARRPSGFDDSASDSTGSESGSMSRLILSRLVWRAAPAHVRCARMLPIVGRQRLTLRLASSHMDCKRANRLLTTLLLVISAWWSVTAQEFALPSAPNSVKFAAIGDAGTGDSPQLQIANQMRQLHAKFPFDRVIMLGDNIYGGQSARDLIEKFSDPYKALLGMGVKFYASLGNHDDPVNVRY